MPRRRQKGEGSIYFLEAKKLWVAKIFLPNGKRKVKYGSTKKIVREWLFEQQKALHEGIFVDETRITVGEFVDRWFLDVASLRLRPSTQVSHERIIRNHIRPTIGHIRLQDLTPLHLQNLYSEKLKGGLSKRTVKYIHTIIHQSLDQAQKWGIVIRNVADAADSPYPDRKPVEPLTREQVAQLFDALRFDRLYPLYVVFLGCGLRRGEALGLTVDDIDFENGVIHVRKTLQSIRGKGLLLSEPKTEKSRRSVAMPEYVKEVLKLHLENRTVESEFVFCTSNGTPFIPRNILRHFKITLRNAGLPQSIRIHDLRHTFVSYLLSQNTPPRDVQEIVGHASFSTTVDIYGHLMPGAKQEAAKKMDGFFNGLSVP